MDGSIGFALRVNGVELFCRGACWSPVDPVRLHAPREALAATLAAARDAGMNMLRVGGTMTYESEAFHDLCDELGILVWQDFMFANMDYPGDDAGFAAAVDAEAAQLLGRLQARPSLAVLCGGSEVEQQAAMTGTPPERWRAPLFAERLPAHAARWCPDVPYLPSSPSGGALPFHADAGVTHYYGVGAYLRPLDDARRADVRFAAECLAFSNVPSPAAVDRLTGTREAAGHQPLWKARVPRDPSASWDFEDVRDHYLATLFRVDPLRLRSTDPERYLALSRAVSGEVMAATFAEWRRPGSRCAGALVWLLRDLLPGAGWGVLDADGQPKAAYHHLRRALQPVALLLTDEGVNGLHAHVLNETAQPLDAVLHVALYRDGELPVARVASPVRVAARGGVTHSVEALLGGFHDTTWAYRFGPPGFDLVHARLARTDGHTLGEAMHFPLGFPSDTRGEVGLEAHAERRADGWTLVVWTRAFAQGVAVECEGYAPADDHFHLAPGAERVIALRSLGGETRSPAGTVRALNARTAARIAAS